MSDQDGSASEAGDGTRSGESDDIYVSCCACELSRSVECVDDVLDLQDDHVDATSEKHVIEFDRHGAGVGLGDGENPSDGDASGWSETSPADE
jgi:hypothetical protein